MRTHWILAGLLAAIFLGLFAAAKALGLPLLTDPGPWLSKGGALAAAVGFLLLVGDVLLPVPTSLVMIAHGALFGVLWGTLLSLAGAMGASAFGFALGRRGGRLMERVASSEERRRADALFDRWGDIAVVASRPVPVLAETLAVVAGTTRLSWRRFLLASLGGSVPAALLYALTGATAATLDNTLLVFGLVILVAGLFWLLGYRLRRTVGRASPANRALETQTPD